MGQQNGRPSVSPAAGGQVLRCGACWGFSFTVMVWPVGDTALVRELVCRGCQTVRRVRPENLVVQKSGHSTVERVPGKVMIETGEGKP